MRIQLFFEDLRVGLTFRSGNRLVSAEDIRDFARQFDPQPFHLDEREAERSFFRGIAASGWHTAAMTMRLLVESVPLSGGILGVAVEELYWLKPVRPGDELWIEAEVAAVMPGERSRGLVKIKGVTRNQLGETVQTLVASLLVSKRTPPA